MSSNIRVVKICEYCRSEFIAEKTTSKTCSDNCAKHLYKLNQINSKIFDVFDKEKQEKEDRWIYKSGSLFLTITNPVFHKRVIIQDAKCWLISDGGHFMNYLNYVDSTLAFEFNKK